MAKPLNRIAQVCKRKGCGTAMHLTKSEVEAGREYCTIRCAVLARPLGGSGPRAERFEVPCARPGCGTVMRLTESEIRGGREYCSRPCAFKMRPL